MAAEHRIRLVVFDWAGTTVDHGCFAPVEPFVRALAKHGVGISDVEARGPMGLEKCDHIRALLALPDVASQWKREHGGDPAEPDVDAVFADFVPLQLASVEVASTLIDGVIETAAALRARGVRIGATTGYFAEAAERCRLAAARQGYAPDVALCPSDVAEGRPAPWMIFRVMEQLGVYPASAVVKVGDTAPDIGEALNAGAWAVAVAATGSEVALTAAQLAALPADERDRRVAAAAEKLRAAGAHYVIDSVRGLSAVVEEIDARLARGESPAVADLVVR